MAAEAGPIPRARRGRERGSNTQVALAIFEAVNTIDRHFGCPISGFPLADNGRTAQEAAAAVAAHGVLVAVFPAQRTRLDHSLAFHLGQIADGPAKTTGAAIGRAAAEAVLGRTLWDKQKPQPDYRPRTTPGCYVQPGLPLLSMSAFVAVPWFMKSPDEVQPPAAAGAHERPLRTRLRRSPQAGWAQLDGADRGPICHHRLLVRESRRPGYSGPYRQGQLESLVGNARLYALLEMAIDDAATSVTVAKYKADFWRAHHRDSQCRPGRQYEDDDENPSWMPYLTTPGRGKYSMRSLHRRGDQRGHRRGRVREGRAIDFCRFDDARSRADADRQRIRPRRLDVANLRGRSLSVLERGRRRNGPAHRQPGGRAIHAAAEHGIAAVRLERGESGLRRKPDAAQQGSESGIGNQRVAFPVRVSVQNARPRHRLRCRPGRATGRPCRCRRASRTALDEEGRHVLVLGEHLVEERLRFSWPPGQDPKTVGRNPFGVASAGGVFGDGDGLREQPLLRVGFGQVHPPRVNVGSISSAFLSCGMARSGCRAKL